MLKMNVLVVDDEQLQIRGIVKIIEKNFPELYVADTCRSGREAIEKNYRYKPDIIIMDINMPGINGIDAMKQIREINKDVCFIVVSAFDYFDYAVESVSIGVEQYILKPVREEKLIETLKGAINTVEQKRKSMIHELKNQEMLENMMPVLETSFMNDVCMYDKSTEELKDTYKLFGTSVTSGYVMVIELKKSKIITDRRVRDISRVESDRRKSKEVSVYKKCRDIVKSVCNGDCVVGSLKSKRISIYVRAKEDDDLYTQKNKACDLAKKILKRCESLRDNSSYEENVYQNDIYIGIGSFNESLDNIKKSYKEAIDALEYATKNEIRRIIHISDVEKMEVMTNKDYEEEFETNVCTPLLNNDILLAQMNFEKLYRKIYVREINNMANIKQIIIRFVSEIDKRRHIEEYYYVMEEIFKAIDADSLYSIMKKYINRFDVQNEDDKRKKSTNIISIIDNYIYEHYKEDITLDDVAKLVNFSSYYLSRFYKNETGKRFSDKIMQVRIEKAKELFLNSENSVKDVTYMVGYSDPNYFSKIFKKVTNCTVSEFKKKNKVN